MTPERYLLPFVYLAILLAAFVRSRPVVMSRSERLTWYWTSLALIVQVAVLALVGFRMRYAYFISPLALSLPLLAMIRYHWPASALRTDP